jgi:hypothetical protein
MPSRESAKVAIDWQYYEGKKETAILLDPVSLLE